MTPQKMPKKKKTTLKQTWAHQGLLKFIDIKNRLYKKCVKLKIY